MQVAEARRPGAAPPRLLVEGGADRRRLLPRCTPGPGTSSAPTPSSPARSRTPSTNAERVIRFERHHRPVPRGDAPGAVPAVRAASSSSGTRTTARPTSSSRSSSSPCCSGSAQRCSRWAQQPGDHDRPGHRRLRPVPADAAAAARRAVPEYGGACIESDLRGDEGGTFGYVDTLADYGGPWSFDSEAMTDISNQYAAMPSMHIGWSTWCAVAMWPLLRRRWQRSPCSCTRWRRCSASSSPATTSGSTAPAACWRSPSAHLGWGMHRWNQDRLDRTADFSAHPAPPPRLPDRLQPRPPRPGRLALFPTLPPCLLPPPFMIAHEGILHRLLPPSCSPPTSSTPLPRTAPRPTARRHLACKRRGGVGHPPLPLLPSCTHPTDLGVLTGISPILPPQPILDPRHGWGDGFAAALAEHAPRPRAAAPPELGPPGGSVGSTPGGDSTDAAAIPPHPRRHGTPHHRRPPPASCG